MSFQDIKGQDNAIGFLKSSIRNNKISHAYLFIGPSGVGKKLTAVNFARALNCAKRGGDEEPCGVCAQCTKISASNHPDVFVLSPLKENASFGIDKIRAMTKDINLKPYEGRKKVYILDEADSMTGEAQNALLKTLEEPPSDSVLILIVEKLDHIFTTIQSRAKRVKFFPLPAGEVKAILTDTYKLEQDKAEVLSRISSGEPGKALKYNAGGFFAKRDLVIGGLKDGSFGDSDFDGLSRHELKLLLDVMLTWYRDILVTKAGAGDALTLVNIDRLDMIRAEAKRADFGSLQYMINQLILTCSFLDSNANPKLAMAALGMSLTHR